MPKKTKKEKIIAEYRKKLEMRSEKWDTETGSNKMEISLQNISLPNPTSHIQLPASSSLYIVKDLRKTFLLAILAIGIEVGAYFILI